MNFGFKKTLKAKRLAYLRSKGFIPLKTVVKSLSSTPDFPGSAASQEQGLALAVSGFHETLPALLELQSTVPVAEKIIIKSVDDLYELNEDVLTLRHILNENGSDKGHLHEYDLVYANLLGDRTVTDIDILEIGLGTNNTDTPSHMGEGGIPGASLRSWKKYFPHANIVGCDIDSRILFTEERITTFQLDQTSKSSWDQLKHKLAGRSFNLIIDDGLHAPYANLRTIIEAVPLLRQGGWIVIEDVPDRSLVVWKLLLPNIDSLWESQILKAKKSHLILLRKR